MILIYFVRKKTLMVAQAKSCQKEKPGKMKTCPGTKRNDLTRRASITAQHDQARVKSTNLMQYSSVRGGCPIPGHF